MTANLDYYTQQKYLPKLREKEKCSMIQTA